MSDGPTRCWCGRRWAVSAAIACSLVLSGSSGPAGADELFLPGLGSRVRIQSPAPGSGRLVGTLTAVDQTHLTVVPQDGGEPRVVARHDITRLERSVRPSQKSKGALIGFGVGLAAMVGKAAAAGGCNDGCNGENVLAAGLVALGTATVGAIAAPGERWMEMAVGSGQARATTPSPRRLRVRLVPKLGRRIGLTVVATF
jgi:hypothetical protein